MRAGGPGQKQGAQRLWPVVFGFCGPDGKAERAEGTRRSVTPELEKSVMTWIGLQSSTQLTFNLPGVAGASVAGVCLGTWVTCSSGCLGREERGPGSGEQQRAPWGLQTLPALSGYKSALWSQNPRPRPSALPPRAPREGPTAGGSAGEGRRKELFASVCLGRRSSVFLSSHLFLPLLTRRRRGWEERAGEVPSWPAPSEPGLLPRAPRPRPARAPVSSVWRSHSAPRRLAGSGSRQIGEPGRPERLRGTMAFGLGAAGALGARGTPGQRPLPSTRTGHLGARRSCGH